MIADLIRRIVGKHDAAEAALEPVSAVNTQMQVPTEYIHAKEFMDRLVRLEHGLHGSGDPNEIVMGALKAGCEHYDAEWCGVLDADLEVGVFTPYWWYTPVENDRTTELFREFEFSENFPRWVEALKSHTSIVVPDIEAIRESQPEEYASYRRLEVEAVIGTPYQKRSIGFLAVKNPKRYPDRPEFLQMLSYVVVAEVNERKLIESAKKSPATKILLGEKDVRVKLFGGLEIETAKGKMTEADMKSPKGCRILVYLLLNQHRKISSRVIADDLWPEDETDNAMRNIRALLYRLRQNTEFMWEESLIETTANGYRLNPAFHIITDFGEFEECCRTAKKVAGSVSKIDLLLKAVTLYKGSLFPSAMPEQWLLPFENQYRLKYMEAMGELLRLLYAEGRYSETYQYSTAALGIDNTSLDFWYWSVVALRKIASPAIARRELETAASVLPEEDYKEMERRLQENNG